MASVVTNTQSPAVDAPGRPEVAAIALSVGLGLAVLFVAGFAGPEILHTVAHDGRHALSFPCH
ncbi:MAG: CbtB-domain containing protein [Proteobacteria bacterium]|nr:CbtB-domain containing protein [Pseudomonadota bacterium]